jgi:hypothetical protein
MDWNEFVNGLEATREVDIETSRGPGAPVHRTTIWPAPEGGELYVRSLRGMDGRWWKELMANPEGVLHADGEEMPVRAVPATDRDSVAKATSALRRKYASSPYLDSMIRPEINDTTLRLEPR